MVLKDVAAIASGLPSFEESGLTKGDKTAGSHLTVLSGCFKRR